MGGWHKWGWQNQGKSLRDSEKLWEVWLCTYAHWSINQTKAALSIYNTWVHFSRLQQIYRCLWNKHSSRCRWCFLCPDPAPLISKLTPRYPTAANKHECLFHRPIALTLIMSRSYSTSRLDSQKYCVSTWIQAMPANSAGHMYNYCTLKRQTPWLKTNIA